MSKVRIVTDSTSDMPVSLREQLNIEMVPLKIHFGTETYLDGIDLEADAFYQKLASSSLLPTTSQPSPAEFVDLYSRILKEEPDTKIISIHLSSAMSGTYQSAVLAKTLIGEDASIYPIDSKSACFGIGWMVQAAAEAAKEGKSVEECMKVVEELRANLSIYFLVDTLEYLQKGGRIGKAAALFGSLLNIKPILSLDKEGEVCSMDKVRGEKKAMNRIMEFLRRDMAERPIHMRIAHASNLKGAEQLAKLLEQQFDVRSKQYLTIGPVIGSHAGPGTVAAFVTPALA
ncbi:DegV family protein [Paenibacillus larvae]|uniref:EDD domain protein, DegV family n=2 Tax=Paenibacillus larvae subsp. larvae TaxID=147375 RepID=V9W801_9BACL|nr:DegV family protein [Paenibacillus larvae]AHD06054.1 EDD domain protein, DegV family [Paenibacillus larvae subsp. larvae DSM 25430]AQR76449.1 EDD domain protein [Paenibacillus larvae subsp. larvae]AVF22718.1 EDD domain protein, DegV family [Paenibacillus larvae subsp. larvae]AVG12584.1 EDD domain protein, DegV family [Paenibacillus larvae subsp. larvae DSM 25430]ETK25606.1 EDD domain protein, DegV family [Paenibacillus larvae subsp. larvae DSM 25719]